VGWLKTPQKPLHGFAVGMMEASSMVDSRVRFEQLNAGRLPHTTD